jgi:hypothetical protein
VTGLLAADFNYSTSDFAMPVLSGAGKDYVLTFTPLVNKDGAMPVSLKASISAVDEYGNSPNGSNTVNVSYDTRRPVVTGIVTEPAITEIHFDPFTVKVTLDEAVDGFDPGKLILNGLTLVEVLSGPDVVSGTTEYLLSVKVAPNTPSNSSVSLGLAEGAVKDKADNPNLASIPSLMSSVLFVDNIPPDIINMSVPPTSAPPAGDIAFTFDEPLDVTTPGTIWLEDVGTIPVDKINWLDPSTVNFDHGRLADGMTYVVRVSGYLDLAGNMMAPRVFSFTVGEPAYPVIQRPVIIQLGSGLRITPAISDEPFYVSSRDDFTFTVWPVQGGNLDSLTIETGVPLRDLEGIIRTENPDGSVTVTLVLINEPLVNVSVYLKGVAAAEAVEAADVWASGRQIYIRTAGAATLSIYTLNGGLYRQLSVGAGITVESLPQGYYTIVLGGKTYKAVIQ